MSGSRRGEFSLDSRDQMLSTSGAVIPGDSANSRLVHLIRGDDPDFVMPMRGEMLTPDEVALIARWIDEGAVWDAEPEERPKVHPHLERRDVQLPSPHDGIEHAIDLLLADYLARHDAKAGESIDDAAFLRRVSLDIVGLLPEAESLAEFLADDQPNKRGRAVDRLLIDKEAYAAHWMTFWNDLLRNDYAGTGYIDGGRTQITSWLYAALHDNMAYDRFVAELVDPGDASAGFARGIRWRGEASASQSWELQYARNVSQVFLGVNMKCASCHDSFIDEWKLADAYGMAAIIADEPMELFRCDIPTGEFAMPGFLFPTLGDVDPAAEKPQRLSMLASLLVKPANGRTPRTIVNRIWARLMGRGLVEPVDSMDHDAWSEEILDFLANHFVENDYDLKETIRLIVTSAAYQWSSVPAVQDGNFVFRAPTPQRMTAEQFIDAIWTLTGAAPGGINASLGDGATAPATRASLLTSSPLMRSLGRPAREQVVSTRPNSLTTLQALDLANGDEIAEMIAIGAERLLAQADGRDALIEYVYAAALSRQPTEDERTLSRDFLGDTPDAERIADLLWTIFMLPEFQLVR